MKRWEFLLMLLILIIAFFSVPVIMNSRLSLYWIFIPTIIFFDVAFGVYSERKEISELIKTTDIEKTIDKLDDVK